MRQTICFFLIFFFFLCYYVQAQPLFRIVQNDRVGYINDKGEVVIKPVFLSGNDFSEGMAAVRQNGHYGFIDETGKFILPPSYDYATAFVKGIAGVYKNGNILFINKSGEVILPEVYKGLSLVDDKKFIVYTQTGKQGIIDIDTKKLLIDTVFKNISGFYNGVSIVREYIPPATKNKSARVAVIDLNGKFIVPFGKYSEIRQYVDGYATVEIEDPHNKTGDADGVIDTRGNLLFKRPYKNNSYLNDEFTEGLARINLYKYWIPEKNGMLSTSEKNYEGYINLKGEIVFNDTNCSSVTNFSNGRAFIKPKNGNYTLIDRNFKRIGNDSYRTILNDRFKHGLAFVETDDGYGLIDTSGNFLVKPQFEGIDQAGISEGLFFFSENNDDEYLYGIADINGNIITKASFSAFDNKGFVNGLLRVVIGDKLTYLNKKGQVVWQQNEEHTSKLKPLNIDYMNRGYFYAYSSPKNNEPEYSGGWATSSNRPQKTEDAQFPPGALAVSIDTTRIDSFDNTYAGYKLYISNTTGDTIRFNAQDSRLYLKLQAQDKNGVWKDIEYLPSSWCGNSYHRIELGPNSFWSFTIPQYEGELETMIRAELKYITGDNPKSERILFSNVIRGSVNPGQFWNKQAYYPGGLMDPYFD